jgi:hypothetical protein
LGGRSFFGRSGDPFQYIFYLDLHTLIKALWLSGYSDRLEIYFLREQEFESLRRRYVFAHEHVLLVLLHAQEKERERSGKYWVVGGAIE